MYRMYFIQDVYVQDVLYRRRRKGKKPNCQNCQKCPSTGWNRPLRNLLSPPGLVEIQMGGCLNLNRTRCEI